MAKNQRLPKQKQQETIERYAALRQELKAQRLRRLAQTSFRCSSRTIEKS